MGFIGTLTNTDNSITDGTIQNKELVFDSITLGGVTVSLGSTVDQPEFDLTLATNYQSSNLVGLISSTQIEGFGDLVGSGGSGVVGGNLTVNGYVYSNQRTTTGGYRLPDWQIYNTSAGALSFYDSTNTAERLQILSDGDIYTKDTDQQLRFYRSAGDRFGGIRYDGSNFRFTLPVADNLIIEDSSGTALLTIDPTGPADFTSSVTATRFIADNANNTADGGGQIYLNGATGNRIDFNTNGFAAPTDTTRSVGTKIVLSPVVGVGNNVDYGLGIDSNTLWYSVPNFATTHKWYGGTTEMMSLTSSNLDVAGNITGSVLISDVANGTAPIQVSSSTTVTNLNADLLDGEEGSYYLDYGNFSGTPTSIQDASNVTINTSTANSNFKVPFANTTVSIGASYGLLQDSTATFTYNPSTNNLLVGGITVNSTGLEITSSPGTIAGSDFANGYLRIGTSTLGWAFDNNEMVTFGDCIINSASGSTLTYTNRPAFNGGTSGSSAPFTVDSTQVVTNLNADLLDGEEGSYYLDYGNFSGTPTSIQDAGNITINTSTANSNFKVPFANTTVSVGATYGLLQDSTATFTYNPSTNKLTAGVIVSNASSGAPLEVTSSTLVTNLNADLLDGQEGTYYLNTSTSFGGDVSGAYNAIVVANDSHTHDTRYFTETESDGRYLRTDQSGTTTGSLTANRFISNTTSQSPLQVSSTILVDNLNAEFLSGLGSSYYLEWSNIQNVPTDLTDLINDDAPQLGGNLDTNEFNIQFGDSSGATNDRLQFGVGQDLQIYHDGNDSWIDESGAGNLYLKSNGGAINLRLNNTDQLTINEGTSTEINYGNSKKFETISIGVSISNGGTNTATIAGPENLILDPSVVGDNTGIVRIKGDLIVDGTTTQINSTALDLADFIIGIATTATTDLLADGAGIRIGPDNTFTFDNTYSSLKSSENLNLASGKTYKIDGTDVLSASTLGSNVTESSLTTVGTISVGTWQGSSISATYIEDKFLRNDGGDTTVGDITISKTSPKLILNDTNEITGSYPGIQFDTNNNQGVLLEHNELNGELPVDGYGLILKGSPNNTQFPGTDTLTFTVLGDIYAGSTTVSSTTRVLTTADEGSGNGLDADTLDGFELSGSSSVSDKIFNNKGQNHTTVTDFNTAMNPGANYLQGGGNGPTGTASDQWYGFMLGLGDDYGTTTGEAGDYASQFYWNRQNQGANPYLWARDMEAGVWGSWRKFSAGNADTLDSLDSTQFLRSDADATATGAILIQNQVRSTSQIRATGWYESTTGTTGNDLAFEIGVSAGEAYALSYNRATTSYGAMNLAAASIDLQPQGGGNATVSGSRILTTADEGTGNGLDADTVDGLERLSMEIAKARAAGWVPAYTDATESNVVWNYTENAVEIKNSADNTGGAAYKAMRMKSGDRVRIQLQVKGTSAFGSGLYIRIYFYNGDLPDGKTHVSNSATYSLVQEDSSGDTTWYENNAITTSYVGFERTYTAPADGYMSVVILNWAGITGTNSVYVLGPDIQFENVSFATTATQVSNSLTPGNFLSGTSYNGSVARTFDVNATDSNTGSTVVARDSLGNFSAGTITATLNGTATQVSNTLTRGTYLTGDNYNGSAATTWAVNATDSNTGSTVVARDASGNFSAGTITATLSGNASSASQVSNSLTPGNFLSGTSYNGSVARTFDVNATDSNTGSTVVARDASGNFSAGTITATLNGSASSSGTATNANNINCSATTDSTTFPVLVGSSAGGNSAPLVDSDLSYDASATDPLLTVGIATHGGIRIGSTITDSYDSTGNDAITTLDATRHRQGRFPASGGITNSVGTAGIKFSDGDIQRHLDGDVQTAGSFAIFGRSSTTAKSDNFIWGSPSNGMRIGYSVVGLQTAGFIVSKTTVNGTANPVDILRIAGDTDDLTFTGGDVGIGTDTPAAGRKFDVEGSAQVNSSSPLGLVVARDRAIQTYLSLGSNSDNAVRVQAGSAGTRNVDLEFYTSNSGSETKKLTIAAAGDATFTNDVNAVNFNSTSDIKLKENIEVITDSTSILREVKGVKFDWKETKTSSIGVIAQDIEKVLPQLVSEGDDETKRVNYNGLVGVLIEAVKELTARVEELESRQQ